MFFCVCESIGIVRFHVRPKNEAVTTIFIRAILINNSYFQLDALKPGIGRFSGFASLLALSFFMCDRLDMRYIMNKHAYTF